MNLLAMSPSINTNTKDYKTFSSYSPDLMCKSIDKNNSNDKYFFQNAQYEKEKKIQKRRFKSALKDCVLVVLFADLVYFAIKYAFKQKRQKQMYLFAKNLAEKI